MLLDLGLQPEARILCRDLQHGHRRIKADLELKLFRALIVRTGDAIYGVDPKTARFLDVNESYLKSIGYTRQVLLEMIVMDVTEGKDMERFYANDELMNRTGSARVENPH